MKQHTNVVDFLSSSHACVQTQPWSVFVSRSGIFQLVFIIAAKQIRIDRPAGVLSSNKCQKKKNKNKTRQRTRTIIDFASNAVNSLC